MGDRGSSLAARFRAALQSEEEARQAAKAAAEAAAREAVTARAELLGDLEDFGAVLEVVKVVRDSDGLTLRYGDRYVHFAAVGDRDRIRVEFDGQGDNENLIYRQAELGNRWVWSRRRGARHDLLPLFDQGLEELMVSVLGMPRPSDSVPAERAEPATTEGRSL